MELCWKWRASISTLLCAVAWAVDRHDLVFAATAEAFHSVVLGLVEENGRFCAAPFMVWMYCELPDSPISANF